MEEIYSFIPMYEKGMELAMVKFNIESLLKKNGKSKYWLCKNMNITSRNLNRIIYGETTSISFKYLEDMCKFLNCDLSDLISIDQDNNINNKGA